MAFIRKFCGCLSLELGTIVIGWLGILQGSLCAIIILTNYSTRLWPQGIEEPYNIDYLRVLLAIAQLVFSVQLVISVKCQRSAFMLPWLVINLLDLVDRIALLGSVIFSRKHIVEVDVRQVALAITLMLLVLEIWCYCWLCVLCFYLELRKVIQKYDFDSFPVDMDNIDTEMYIV